MTKKSTLTRLPIRSSIIALSIHTVVAADGLWTNPAGGSWASAGNWSAATIADGSGFTADFSTLDIAADATVTLDGPRTIGILRFADATTPSNNWILAPGTGGPLTLSSIGVPQVLVNSQSADIGAVVEGTQGINKGGAGVLTLSGANTFSGLLQVGAGTVKAGNAAALGAAGAGNETVVASGATFDVNGSALSPTEIVHISGSGVGSAGALVNTGVAQQNALNRVVLNGNATVGGTTRFDIRPGTAPTLDLAGFTLTKTGANQFSMVGTTITPGSIVINEGTFSIETTSVVNASGLITINSPGILGVYGNAMDGATTPAPLFMRPIVSNNGTISNLNSDANIGGTVAINTGTTLTLTGGFTTQMRGVISGTGSMLKTGPGTFAFLPANTFVGKTTVTGGHLGMHNESALGPAPATFQADQLTLDGGGLYTVAGGFFYIGGGPVFSGTRGITVGANGAIFDAYGHANARSRIGLNSLVSGPGGITKNGGGVLEILTPNTYGGSTTVTGGPDISDTAALAAIQLGDYGGLSTGALNFTNTGAINGLRFLASGNFTNNVTLSSAVGSRTRFVADGNVTAVIDGLIEGGSFDGPELQFGGGAGTIVLNGDKTYASDTVVNGGTLILNGSIEASDTVVKAGGTIGGSGTVRLLTLEDGATILAATPPLNSIFGVDAFKTTTGVNVLVRGGSPTPGVKTVDVVAYGDDTDGVPPDIANFNTAAYRGATLSDDTVNNKITLSYTSSALTWNGTGPNWDVATSASWVEGTGMFYQGDAVTFNNPAAESTVTLAGQLAPSSITVNNTNTYTFSNTGTIVSGSLVKTGTGMLVLPGANSFDGGTTINGGTISLSASATASGSNNPGALGTGPVTVNSTGLLKLWIANGATSYFSNPITLNGGRILGEDGVNVLKGGVTLAAGGGTMSAKWNNKNVVVDSVMSGPGKLTVYRETPSGETQASVILTKANTYTGGTDILSGFLRVAYSDSALSTGTVTFTGAGTLATAVNGGPRTVSNAVSLPTGIIGSLDGGQFPLTLSGVISGPGTLQSTSSGLIVLSGANTYTGGTNVTGTALLRLDSPGALGSTGTISMTGGTLQASAANTADYSARFSSAAGQLYRLNTNGQSVAWASPLLSSNGSLWKYGPGTLTVTGASTYGGGTNVQGGVLETALVSDTGATPIGTFGTAGGSFLSLGGGTFRYTGSAVVSTARSLWSDQVASGIEVTNPAAVLTFTGTGGNINKPFTKSGAGSLVITQPINNAGTTITVTGGNLTLNGANTYTGDSLVSGGTLTLGTATLPNTADVRLGTGGSLVLNFEATDVVDEFYIDGVAQAAGTWGSLASTATNKTSRITGTGILSVTTGGSGGGNAYDTWASAAGLTGANNGKLIDADMDGWDNLTEFALDGAPLSGIRGGKMVSKIATVGGVSSLTLTLPVRTGATFSGTTEKTSAAINGVIYKIQGTETLSSYPLEVIEVTGADATALQSGMPALSTGWTYRSFRLAGAVTATSKKFMRVVISEG
ncbi:autotransporter-associated beta strand repeat-containing protein [Luteolibacter sp. GHJ8]|uniref:Autotransporter-associated beta strand repeat-containing protein n=1 Tax=Luteolibacter rhizosphaerae TaxID=2989719 RepID=A0ABT3G941_9BACT|nr:autotransporter-associated beta strand repeat-containing protein [Luteolibacter rhizosphaerae]MCW1916373.1 autotransporter-associated beta strand repeat-containing protein [Luteolibacter rhizosphaerae]